MDVPPPPPFNIDDFPIKFSTEELAAAAKFRELQNAEQRQLEEQAAVDFDRPEHTRLDHAIKNGNAELMLAELHKARERYPYPQITLNSALECAIEHDQPELAMLLLANGVNANHKNLLRAVSHGFIPIVQRIMEGRSWSINDIPEGCNHTLLTKAILHKDMVEWLLDHGADPNLEDPFAETPLSLAAQQGCFDVIDLLLSVGADVTKGAILYQTLLNDAATSYALASRFIELGAPVNKVVGENSPGWDFVGFERETALHIACKKRYINVVELLLDHGADPTVNQRLRSEEIAGSSPLELARKEGNSELVALLEKYDLGARSKSNL